MNCKKSVFSVLIGLAAVMIFASLFCVPAFASPTSPKANWIKYKGSIDTYWEYWESDTPFFIDPTTQEIKNSANINKYYTNNNGSTWTAGGSVWSGFGSNNPSNDNVWNSAGTLFKLSSYSTVIHNTDLLNRKDNTVYQKGTDNLINNFYIQDNAGLLNKSIDEVALLEMEKKWEQNVHMQFFIYTYTENPSPSEIMAMRNFADSKGATGWGSCTLFIQKTSTDWRVGFGTSKRFSGHIKFPYKSDYVYSEFYKLFQTTTDINSQNLLTALGQIYQAALYGHGNNTIYNTVLHPFTSLMNCDSCTDASTDNYQLLNATININNSPQLEMLQSANSIVNTFSFDDTYSTESSADWLSNDVRLFGYGPPRTFFWNVNSAYIPLDQQTGLPIPVDGEKSPFNQETGGTVNPAGTNLGGLKLDGLSGKLTAKIPTGHFLQSFTQLSYSQADYKTLRPTIKISLKALADSSSNISHVTSNLSDDVVFLDFSQLDSLRYGGISVIEYFRGLMTAFMLFYTGFYVWKKLISSFGND